MWCRSICLAVFVLCTGNCGFARSNADTCSLVIDTVFEYTLGKDSIPKVFKEKITAFKQTDAVMAIVVEGAYLFRNEIFIPARNASKRIKANTSDECFYSFTGLDGKQCAARGCITGVEAGACAGMLSNGSGSKKIRIKLIVHAGETTLKFGKFHK